MNKSFVFGWMSGVALMAAPALLIAGESIWNAAFIAGVSVLIGVVHEVFP